MNRIRTFATIAVQVAILWLISCGAHKLVAVTDIPLPGNVVGLLLTFAALCSGRLPIQMIEKGGGVLLRHMSLLFVPFAAGIGEYAPLLTAHGPAIGTALGFSAAVGYAVTGWVAQAGLRKSATRGVATVVQHG